MTLAWVLRCMLGARPSLAWGGAPVQGTVSATPAFGMPSFGTSSRFFWKI